MTLIPEILNNAFGGIMTHGIEAVFIDVIKQNSQIQNLSVFSSKSQKPSCNKSYVHYCSMIFTIKNLQSLDAIALCRIERFWKIFIDYLADLNYS